MGISDNLKRGNNDDIVDNYQAVIDDVQIFLD